MVMHFRSHLKRGEWIPHGGFHWAERSIGWFQEDFEWHIEDESANLFAVKVFSDGRVTIIPQ